jgi:ATP synthase F1 gamma subunit
VVLGHRGQALVEAEKMDVAYTASSPTSPDGIDRVMRRVAEDVYGLYDRENWSALHLLYAVHKSVGRFDIQSDRILPLDRSRVMEEARERSETGKKADETASEAKPRRAAATPSSYMGRGDMLAALIEEFFYVEFYRAYVETVSAENSMRLQSMEAAKSNIDDTMEQLERMRQILRQDQITGELLDVISGAEAVKS